MTGIPVHDEQGTRQRPFILTIDFDPRKIDAALKSLGREAWTAERPRLILFVAVDNGTAPYVLTSDGTRGRDQREAFVDSAWLYGVPIGLPMQTSLNELGLFVEAVPSALERSTVSVPSTTLPEATFGTSANLTVEQPVVAIERPGFSNGSCNGGPKTGAWWTKRALLMAKRAHWN